MALWQGGGCVEHEITYSGDSLEEIEQRIDKDRTDIEYWMRTGFDEGSECFKFGSFMIKKKIIAAIELTEADF